jgi:electron transport complex protein RnfC
MGTEMQYKLYPIHGGLRLEDHKTQSMSRGLQQAGLPDQLFLPLKQHIGEVNKPLVNIGARTLFRPGLKGAGNCVKACF